MTQLEICINADDLQQLEANVAAAWQGGASRIELCADMQQQGMTPGLVAMQKARRAFADRPGLLVMVRYRSDDQLQTKAELVAMQQAISQAADGVVNYPAWSGYTSFGTLGRPGKTAGATGDFSSCF
jgi:copper homeostasis protein